MHRHHTTSNPRLNGASSPAARTWIGGHAGVHYTQSCTRNACCRCRVQPGNPTPLWEQHDGDHSAALIPESRHASSDNELNAAHRRPAPAGCREDVRVVPAENIGTATHSTCGGEALSPLRRAAWRANPAHRRRGCSRGLSVSEVARTNFHPRLHFCPGATRHAPRRKLYTVVAIAQGMDHPLQEPERA
jgi:hypothetical protein